VHNNSPDNPNNHLIKACKEFSKSVACVIRARVVPYSDLLSAKAVPGSS